MNYNNLKSLEKVEVENRTLRMSTKYLRADNCGTPAQKFYWSCRREDKAQSEDKFLNFEKFFEKL